MVEQITANIYRVKIPMPGASMGTANSYLVKGAKKSLIIDTGPGRAKSLEVMGTALTELGVDLDRTDFFITHMHSDHVGLLSSLAVDTAKVYLNQWEMGWFNVTDRSGAVLNFARLHGLPDEELDAASHHMRDFEISLNRNLKFHFLQEGDMIDMGDVSLRCIEAPGHTRGHLCLFEPDRRIFFAGDHILSDVSPVLEFMRTGGWEPLKEYLASLEKVRGLDIELMLPGHGNPFRGHRERIDELKAGHERRLKEVVSLLKNGQNTAFQLASRMTWNVLQDSWNLVPPLEKIIVVGKAVACLEYLEKDGEVRSRAVEGHIMYSLEGIHGNGTS